MNREEIEQEAQEIYQLLVSHRETFKNLGFEQAMKLTVEVATKAQTEYKEQEERTRHVLHIYDTMIKVIAVVFVGAVIIAGVFYMAHLFTQ
jgi:hypothetical protein